MRPSINVRPSVNMRPSVNVWPSVNARPSINGRPSINMRPGIKPWKTIMVQTYMLHCNGTNTVMVKTQGLTLNPGKV